MPRRSTRSGLMPAQAVYQPLQLENFAQPLAQQQQKYDQTVSAFEDADFGIAGLSPDSEKGAQLAEQLINDKEKVLEELKRTKNYRQAAKRLKKLNKVYNEDPEISGIRTQKSAFEQEKERNLERLKKGELTEKDFKRWQNKTLYDYQQQGGYGFDREVGTGRQISIPTIEENIENDIFKAFDAAAKGAPANKIAELHALKDKFGISEGQWKTITEVKDKENLSRELLALFSQNQNFKNYLENRSQYEWFENFTSNKDYPQEVINEQLSKLQKEANRITNASPSQISEEDKQTYLANLSNQANQFATAAYEAEQAGKLDQFAESVFKSNYVQDTLKPLADATADVYDYNKFDANTKGYRDPEGGRSAKTTKVLENRGIINTYKVPRLSTDSGLASGTSRYETQLAEEALGDYKEFYQTIDDNFKPFESSKEDMLNFSEEELEYRNKKSKEINIASSLADRLSMYDEKIDNSNLRLQEIEELLSNSDNLQEGEANALRVEMSQLNEDIFKTKYTKQYAYKDLEFLFEDAIQKENIDSELQRIYEKPGDKGGLKGVSQYIIENSQKELDEFEDAKTTEIALKTAQEKSDRFGEEFDPTGIERLSQENIEKLEKWEESKKLNFQNKETSGFYDLMEKWYEKSSKTYIPDVTELAIDQNTINFVGEDNYQPYKHILTELNSGDLGGFKVVQFDNSSGKIIGNPNDLKDRKIDTKSYNLENPRFQGVATHNNRDQLIFRVARDSMSDKDLVQKVIGGGTMSEKNQKVLSLLKAYRNDPESVNLDSKANTDVQNAVKYILDWERNNPENVQLMVQGSSASLVKGAQESLINGVKIGLETGDAALTKNIIESYATIDVMGDTDIRRDYNEIAVSLRKEAENKTSQNVITSMPHTFVQNEDGTKTGHIVKYNYDADRNQVVGTVWRATLEKNSSDVLGMEAVETIPLGLVPDANRLRQISVYYGTGEEKERIIDNEQRSFVPAFQSNELFKNIIQGR